MITLCKMGALLPLWLLHAIGWGLGWLLMLCSTGYRRRFVDHAILAGLNPRQWLNAVAESGKLAAELPRVWMGRPVHVEWQGVEALESALATQRGLVFLTPHLGCFEVAPRAFVQRFGHQHVLRVMYRPPRQAWLHRLVQAARQKDGLQMVPTTLAGVRQMLRALKNGESVGLLPDQVPPYGMGVMAPFFGRDAYTMTLSVRLVQQTGAAIWLAWAQRLPWGRGYQVHVQALDVPLPDDVQEAVTVVNRAMEALIKQCPQQYLWGYARYKQPRRAD